MELATLLQNVLLWVINKVCPFDLVHKINQTDFTSNCKSEKKPSSDIVGGTSSGTCASGFGVCCSLTAYCGGTTSSNNTYFVSQSADTSPCTFNVCKASDDICQIRYTNTSV